MKKCADDTPSLLRRFIESSAKEKFKGFWLDSNFITSPSMPHLNHHNSCRIHLVDVKHLTRTRKLTSTRSAHEWNLEWPLMRCKQSTDSTFGQIFSALRWLSSVLIQPAAPLCKVLWTVTGSANTSVSCPDCSDNPRVRTVRCIEEI